MKILVVDDMAVFREPIAASLRLAGNETHCASDGEEALAMVRASRPDLILLDASMPKMDGLTFLKHLRADPSLAPIRVILLTALSEKKYVLAAGALGVRDYLLKSRFRLADLLERINQPAVSASTPSGAALDPKRTALAPKSKTAAPATQVEDVPARTVSIPITPEAAPAPPLNRRHESLGTPRLLTREQFLQRVEGVLQAKTLSGVVTQVLALVNSPNGEMSQLASLIARDPMLSARVLRAANSSAYSSKGAIVTTISDAIRKVGFSAVRNIAAALGVFDCVPEAGADGFDPIRCWQHSFAVAQLCERLATAANIENAGLAYVVGLCHDLGEIFVRTHFGKECQQVADTAARTGEPLDKLHREMLGMSHGQMLTAVLRYLSLPEAIREPIEAFHSTGGSQASQGLARILWMAENYANGAMLPSGGGSHVAPLTQAFCSSAVGTPNPVCPDPVTFRAEVLSLTVTLARLSTADEAKLLVPMFSPQSRRIWVARDPEISKFDPIAAAVASLGEVVFHDRLPAVHELGNVEALVVLARSSLVRGFTAREIVAATTVGGRGSALPILAIAADVAGFDPPASIIRWRPSVTLSELASFAAGPAASSVSTAAA